MAQKYYDEQKAFQLIKEMKKHFNLSTSTTYGYVNMVDYRKYSIWCRFRTKGIPNVENDAYIYQGANYYPDFDLRHEAVKILDEKGITDWQERRDFIDNYVEQHDHPTLRVSDVIKWFHENHPDYAIEYTHFGQFLIYPPTTDNDPKRAHIVKRYSKRP